MGFPKQRVSIPLNREELTRFHAVRQSLGATSNREALLSLLDLYEGRSLDTLLGRIRQMYERGLSVREIRSLKILATYLDFVLCRGL